MTKQRIGSTTRTSILTFASSLSFASGLRFGVCKNRFASTNCAKSCQVSGFWTFLGSGHLELEISNFFCSLSLLNDGQIGRFVTVDNGYRDPPSNCGAFFQRSATTITSATTAISLPNVIIKTQII